MTVVTMAITYGHVEIGVVICEVLFNEGGVLVVGFVVFTVETNVGELVNVSYLFVYVWCV